MAGEKRVLNPVVAAAAIQVLAMDSVYLSEQPSFLNRWLDQSHFQGSA